MTTTPVKYRVTYVNPNNVIRTEPYVETYSAKSQVNALVRRARQYPGSLEILEVVKITAKGETAVAF